MKIIRPLIRWGLIGGLALGGMALLVGPDNVAAGLSQARHSAQGMIGDLIDDPTVLRMQLEDLADEYPDRIAEVRGEIAEIDTQLGQFERDVEIAERVVSMTTDDLRELQVLVKRAEDEMSSGNARHVVLRFEGVRFDLDEAMDEAHRINHVRVSYGDRLAHSTQQVKFLTEQKARLADILNTLETEYSTYQTQLWALEREIDAIERNDRLIELTEAHEDTLRSYNKYGKVDSLKQVQGKLAELRAVQEAQLQALSKRGVNKNYENRAELDIAGEEPGDYNGRYSNPFADLDTPAVDTEADVKEISTHSDSLAALDIIIVE